MSYNQGASQCWFIFCYWTSLWHHLASKLIQMLSLTKSNSRMNIVIKTCFPLLLAAALSGCASYYGAATITSYPSGAEVINTKDGTVLGVTPTTVWWKDSSSDRQHITLRLKLDGYYDKVTPFWLSMRHKSQQDAMNAPQAVESALQRRGD